MIKWAFLKRTPISLFPHGEEILKGSDKVKLVKGVNDLATVNPTLAEEWNYEKNSSFTPDQVTAGSNKKVWWKCNKGHEWEATVESRSRNGCPYCSGKKALKGFNDLVTTSPTLAEKWNYEKNGTLTPDQVTAGSGKKVWWKCEHGHEWEATVCNRTLGRGCPYCMAIKKTSFAEQAISYYLNKVTTVKGRWTGMGKEIDVYLPEIRVGIEYNGLHWHKEKEKQDRIKINFFKRRNIRMVTVAESNQNVVRGDIIEHKIKDISSLDWAIKEIFNLLGLEHININSERDRIEILNKYYILEKNGSLDNKKPILAEEWNYEKNGTLAPDMFMAGSNKKVWWKCEHGHEWEAVIASRSSGNGCPFCAGKKALKGFNDLATANPTLAKEWNYEKNGSLTPDQVTEWSNKKVWWKCKHGHEWEAIVNNRSKGNGCPYCSGRKK